MSYEVHWYEGLLMLPHHLQRMQRGFQQSLQNSRRVATPYHYGLLDLEVAVDKLENNNLLQVHKLRAIMPSGIEVVFPGNAELETLPLVQAAAGTNDLIEVYLALPLWQEHYGNTLEVRSPSAARSKDERDRAAKMIYALRTEDVADENDGRNKKAIQRRYLNARLMLEGDDRSDMEVLPILRLVPSPTEKSGRFRLDDRFVGTCLAVNAAPVLFSMLRDCVNHLEDTRSDLVAKLERRPEADTVYSKVMIQSLRMLALSRAAGKLRAYLDAAKMSPFEWFLELRSLHWELAGLQSVSSRPAAIPYQHHRLYETFEELIATVRRLAIHGAVTASSRSDFRREKNFLSSPLDPSAVSRAREFYLVAQSQKTDATAVSNLITNGNQFILSAPSVMHTGDRGLELTFENMVPEGLGTPRGALVFRIARSTGRLWPAILQEKALAAHWNGYENSDIQLALYILLAE